MLEKLLRPDDVMERYQCSRNTAIRYMRQMVHQEKPLTVTESALADWERNRTIDPAAVDEVARRRRQKKVASPAAWMMDTDWHIPRQRPQVMG